jgi:uncharacterized protein DUF4352
MIIRVFLLTLVGVLFSGAAVGQDPATSGTQQVPGVAGKFGTTYTILLNDAKLNLTVVGAEYSVAPINVNATNMDTADSTHKFLVVHYRVKNPNASDLYLGAGNLFQAVDAQGHTFPDAGNCRRESERHTLDLSLKAGQGADDLLTYVLLPGEQTIPKLILTLPVPGTNAKVIRFDLTQPVNHVKSLPAPYADTADKTGAVARPQIPSVVGTAYLAGSVNLTVGAIALAPGPFGSVQADDGKRFLVVTVTLANPGWLQRYLAGDALKPTVITDDDNITDFDRAKANHDEEFSDATLNSGENCSYRILIKVPKDAKLKSLSLKLDMGNGGMSREFLYDLTGVK